MAQRLAHAVSGKTTLCLQQLKTINLDLLLSSFLLFVHFFYQNVQNEFQEVSHMLQTARLPVDFTEMDNRSPLKEAVNPRPSRLMKPGSLLKPPTQVSHLPKPASASQLPKAPSASQLKRKAEPVEQPAAKKTRVVAPLRKPASNGVTSTAPRSCTQRPGMANRSAASRPTAGAVASRPIASRAPAVRPAVGAAKPRVGGVTRPGVTAKTNAVKRPSDGQVKKLEAENEDLQEQLQRMQRSKEKAETEVEDLEALLRKAKRNLEE
ncbi:hypothetical protein CAPTEDRAFT_193280, partial [Capitella teleta]